MTVENPLDEQPEGTPLRWLHCDRSRVKGLRGTAVWSGRGYSGSQHGQVHPIDGLPKLFGFDLDGEKIRYRSRFLRNAVYRSTVKSSALPPMIHLNGEATGRSRWRIWHALRYLKSLGDAQARAQTTGALDVQNIHGRIFVGYDGPSYALEIDLKTFETRSECRAGRGLGYTRLTTGAAAYARSPDGRLYNHVVATDLKHLGRRAQLCLFELLPSMKRRYFEKVELQRVLSIHNIAATDSYLIVALCPEQHNLLRLLKTGSVRESLEERLDLENEFLLFDRQSGRLHKRIRTPLRFFFNHIIQAQQREDRVRIDLIEISKLHSRLELPRTPTDPSLFGGTPVRYELDLRRETVSRSRLWPDVLCEMPYGDAQHAPPGYANCFEKTAAGQRVGVCSIYEQRSWLPEAGWHTVPAPVWAQGLILLMTTSPDLVEQRFVILDAGDFSVVAEAEIPFRAGLMGHGTWFPFSDHSSDRLPRAS